jgi:SAM-dependent methyltransferase
MSDERRVYYDHEPAYRAIAEAGGRGWDDRPGQERLPIVPVEGDSYWGLEAFLESEWAPPPTQALEVGSGGGQASMLLARRGHEVLGVDFSETAVELARQNALREGLACRFERADVTRLEGCASGAFGLVVDNHCMHCVVLAEHRRSAWSELVRVLRPGGIFFGETMSREGSYDPAIVPVDPETHVARNHTRIWVSEQEVRAELAAARLELLALRKEDRDPGTGALLWVVAHRPR